MHGPGSPGASTNIQSMVALPLVRTGSNDTTCSDLANSAGVPVCVAPTASPVSCACASAVCLN